MGIQDKANRFLFRLTLGQKRKTTTQYELLPVINGHQLQDLSVSEVDAVNQIRATLGTKPTLGYWKLFKTYTHFDSRFVADDDFMPVIIRCLNPTSLYGMLQYKGGYPTYYSSLKQPKILVNSIRGVWYDDKMHTVEANNMYETVFAGVDSIIVKPTMGSCGGLGVRKYDIADEASLAKFLAQYGDDFVVQEVVKQSELTAQFCKDSLNTFRISTLNINGKCTAETVVFRHGREKSVCDNLMAGGIMVGVNRDGSFAEYGWDNRLNRYAISPSGVKYKDVTIPNFEKLLQYVQVTHATLLPTMGFAGWDFALDENNEPIFIEVNLGYPGIMFEQLASKKPIFGERTEEVYKFVAKEKKKLVWRTDFVGSAL